MPSLTLVYCIVVQYLSFRGIVPHWWNSIPCFFNAQGRKKTAHTNSWKNLGNQTEIYITEKSRNFVGLYTLYARSTDNFCRSLQCTCTSDVWLCVIKTYICMYNANGFTQAFTSMLYLKYLSASGLLYLRSIYMYKSGLYSGRIMYIVNCMTILHVYIYVGKLPT